MLKRILVLPLCLLCLTACGQLKPNAAYSDEMPPQRTLKDIQNAHVELIEGESVILNGRFTEDAVNDAKDAFRVMASMSELLGIEDFKSEIRFQETLTERNKVVYQFSQIWKELPVKGVILQLIVDAESHKVLWLNSTYRNDLTLNTEPALPAENACQIAAERFHVKADGEPALQIYAESGRTPRLTWLVITDGQPNRIWLDANTGETIFTEYQSAG